MYGFPADLNPSVFGNKRLVQLRLLENCVFLDFEEEVEIVPRDRALETVQIRVDSCLTYTSHDGATEHEDVPHRNMNLNSLVGAVVVRATVDEASTLTLDFGGGRTLSCYEDAANYECYNITFGGHTYYV